MNARVAMLGILAAVGAAGLLYALLHESGPRAEEPGSAAVEFPSPVEAPPLTNSRNASSLAVGEAPVPRPRVEAPQDSPQVALAAALQEVDWTSHLPALQAMYLAKIKRRAPETGTGAMRSLAELLAELEPAFRAAGVARMEDFMLLSEVRVAAVAGVTGSSTTPDRIATWAATGNGRGTLTDVVMRAHLDQALYENAVADVQPSDESMVAALSGALLLSSGDVDLTGIGGAPAAAGLLDYWLSLSGVAPNQCDRQAALVVCREWLDRAANRARVELGTWLEERTRSGQSQAPTLNELPLAERLRLRVAMADVQVEAERDLALALTPEGQQALGARTVARLLLLSMG